MTIFFPYEFKGRKIRFRFLKNNQTIKANNKLIESLENEASNKNLKIDRSNPEHEIWICEYTDLQILWIGFLVEKHKDYHSKENMSELRPEIAYMMNYLGGNDYKTILDPFMGKGSLLKSRLKHFNSKEIYGMEIDNEKIKHFKCKESQSTYIKVSSFFKNGFAENYFDLIITDPPWGKHDKKINIEEFYKKMFIEFCRLLKSEGKIVILTAFSLRDMIKTNISANNLKIENEYLFKVWGHRVNLWQIKKSL